MIHPESALQRGVKRAVKRAVACEHEFICHDRGAEHNEGSHIWEAQRGYRRAWLDTELVLDRGATFRCELKRPGWKPPRDLDKDPHWRDQLKMIDRLRVLGHPADYATSVLEYLAAAERANVPLHSNWRLVAAHEDELVAADIRSQQAKEDARKAGAVPKSKPPRVKASPGRIRRVERVRSRVLF
jgi:hypothetical protein